MKYVVTMGYYTDGKILVPMSKTEMQILARNRKEYSALIFDSLVELRKKYRTNGYLGCVYEVSDDFKSSRFVGRISWDLVGKAPDYKKVYTWEIPDGNKIGKNDFVIKAKYHLNKDGTLGRRLV